MNVQEIQDQIDLKRKELSIADPNDPKKRIKIELRIKILNHQLEIERLRTKLETN